MRSGGRIFDMSKKKPFVGNYQKRTDSTGTVFYFDWILGRIVVYGCRIFAKAYLNRKEEKAEKIAFSF